MPARRRRYRGFTLLEVLIAVIVFSIGLLGTAGLLRTGLRYNDSAYLRSQAALGAYAILDRMRANRGAALAGSYNLASSKFSDLTCGGTSVAVIDRCDWLRDLDAALPSAQGAINCTAAVCTVTVQWDDARAEGATALKQQVLAAQL